MDVYRILLADDDPDDCTLFCDALAELTFPVQLTTVENGEKLLQLLNNKNTQLPDVLFLDLNMPRKSGAECLKEIKKTARLKSLPVIIYSTSFQKDVVKQLYRDGAQLYIRKPSRYDQLADTIHQAILIVMQLQHSQPSEKDFVFVTEIPHETKH